MMIRLAEFGMFEKIGLLLILAIIIATPFIMIHFSKRVTTCEQIGGTMVKTPEGWVCFKMQRITT